MCEKNNNKPIKKAKEDLKTTKEKLNKSLTEGEDKLCEFLYNLNTWRKELNSTPASGN